MKNFQKILILIFSILILGFTLRGKISGQKFISEKWRNSNLNSEENWNLRWSMMNNLRNNYELVGRKKYEIIKLLGNPEMDNRNELTYYLGYTGMGINTGTLIIYVDSNNIVTDLKVHQG